ncbi:MAG: hypothetical protein ABI353_03515, partial [Isosphaeraceae bacterium]
MNRMLVVALLLLLAPAVRADFSYPPFTATITGKITSLSGNNVINPFTGQPLDLAPDLLGMTVQGTLTQPYQDGTLLQTNLFSGFMHGFPVTSDQLASGDLGSGDFYPNDPYFPPSTHTAVQPSGLPYD